MLVVQRLCTASNICCLTEKESLILGRNRESSRNACETNDISQKRVSSSSSDRTANDESETKAIATGRLGREIVSFRCSSSTSSSRAAI